MLRGSVKPSDYPEDEPRPVPFEPQAEEPVRHSAEVRPRYVDVPVDPETRRTTRNLSLGLVALVLATIGLWLSSYFAGATGVVTLAGCLASFGLATLFQRLHVLRQKHSLLLGLGLTALVGSALPFISAGVHKVDAYARENLGGQKPAPAEGPKLSTPPPPPTLAQGNLPSPPATPAGATLPPEDEEEAAPAPKPVKKIAAAPAAIKREKVLPPSRPGVNGGPRELVIEPLSPDATNYITLTEAQNVEFDGHPFLIPAGTSMKFKTVADLMVTVAVGDYEVKIDIGSVKFQGASQERPQDIEKLSRAEAVHRYPTLRDPDSAESQALKSLMEEINIDRRQKEAVYSDPHWPLTLAEQLAQQQGWERADLPPEKNPNVAVGAAVGEESEPAETPGAPKASGDPAAPDAAASPENPAEREAPATPNPGSERKVGTREEQAAAIRELRKARLKAQQGPNAAKEETSEEPPPAPTFPPATSPQTAPPPPVAPAAPADRETPATPNPGSERKIGTPEEQAAAIRELRKARLKGQQGPGAAKDAPPEDLPPAPTAPTYPPAASLPTPPPAPPVAKRLHQP